MSVPTAAQNDNNMSYASQQQTLMAEQLDKSRKEKELKARIQSRIINIGLAPVSQANQATGWVALAKIMWMNGCNKVVTETIGVLCKWIERSSIWVNKQKKYIQSNLIF